MAIMDIHQQDRDPRGYDATQKDYDRTYAALDRLARSKGVPSRTQMEARVIRDEVYLTGLVGNSGDWIRDKWAAHLVTGHWVLAFLLGLLPVLALQDVAGVVLGVLVGWGVFVASRHVRAAGVRRSSRIPS